MSHDENSQVPAAEQQPGDDQWIFNLAADHEARGNGLYGPVTFSATGLVEFVKDVAAHRAGQSQATRAVPIAWMRSNRKECTTAESKAWMENAGFGHWPSIAKEYTIPLYAAPTAQEVTQQAAPTDEEVFGAYNLGFTAGFTAGLGKGRSEATQQAAKAETAEQASLLGDILTLAESGMCHGLLADDYCSQIVAKIKERAPTTSTVSAPEEQAADAARYRYLRGSATDIANVIDKEFAPGKWEYRAGEELDAAIDEAMRTHTAAQAATTKG